MSNPYTPIDKWEIIRRGPYTLVIASTSAQRSQGMQGTTSLPSDTLMLFRGVPAGMYFHTRNCIPLDIVPISNNGEILAIWTVGSNREKIGPTPYFTSKVLEAPAGWFKSKNIKVGDQAPLLSV